MKRCRIDEEDNAYFIDDCEGVRYYESPPLTIWHSDMTSGDGYSRCPVCWTVGFNTDYKWWSSHWMEHASSKDKPQDIWDWLPFNIQMKNESIIIKINY